MKKVMFLALALSLVGALACHGKDVKYVIKGSNAPKDGAKVILVDQATKVPIDSTVVAGGTFTLKGNADEDALLTIFVDGSDELIPFFNDGTQVQLNVAEGILTGSALNTKLSECDRKQKAAYDEYQHFVDAFMALSEEEQIAQTEEWIPKYEAKLQEYAKFFVAMVDENKDNLIPVAFIDQLPDLVAAADDWNKEAGENKLEEILAGNPRIAAHPVVINLKNRRAAADAARKARAERSAEVVGKKFLEYEGPDPDGNLHKLSEYVGKGKWVLVDFWASWCAPCKVEMRNVVMAYQLYHDKGLEIVGISFDHEKEAWTAAITDWEMPWTHLYGMKDGKAVAGELYGVEGIPDNVLVDPDGNIVARGLREQGLVDWIEKIFN